MGVVAAGVIDVLEGDDKRGVDARAAGAGRVGDIQLDEAQFAGGTEALAQRYSDLVFGFDTVGFSQWEAKDFAIEDAYLIFDGFYLSDVDPDTGEDIDELTLEATIAAGVEVSAMIASIEAMGGVTGTAGLDMVDIGEYTGESDGKIRGSEIISRISRPLELFEIAGSVEAFLEIAVKIKIDLGFWSIKKTVYEKELVRITLFEFSIGGGGGGSAAMASTVAVASSAATTSSLMDGSMVAPDDIIPDDQPDVLNISAQTDTYPDGLLRERLTPFIGPRQRHDTLDRVFSNWKPLRDDRFQRDRQSTVSLSRLDTLDQVFSDRQPAGDDNYRRYRQSTVYGPALPSVHNDLIAWHLSASDAEDKDGLNDQDRFFDELGSHEDIKMRHIF